VFPDHCLSDSAAAVDCIADIRKSGIGVLDVWPAVFAASRPNLLPALLMFARKAFVIELFIFIR
jgi:hypothetical protein